MPYSTISSWVLLVAQALDAQGLDSAAVFREAGIDPDRLRDPGARFPVTAIAKVYRLSVAQTQDPAFGLEVARHWHPTTLHALGYSWMASATLRDAVGRFSRYGRMVTDGAQVEIVEGEHSATLGSSVRFEFSEGHTPGLMLSEIGGDGGVAFCADLIPGRPWVHLPITMGYDRYPERLIDEKRRFLDHKLARSVRLFFTHDAGVAAAAVTRDERGRFGTTDEMETLEGLTLAA